MSPLLEIRPSTPDELEDEVNYVNRVRGPRETHTSLFDNTISAIEESDDNNATLVFKGNSAAREAMNAAAELRDRSRTVLGRELQTASFGWFEGSMYKVFARFLPEEGEDHQG